MRRNLNCHRISLICSALCFTAVRGICAGGLRRALTLGEVETVCLEFGDFFWVPAIFLGCGHHLPKLHCANRLDPASRLFTMPSTPSEKGNRLFGVCEVLEDFSGVIHRFL